MPFYILAILAMLAWFVILFVALAVSTLGAKRRDQGDELAEVASMLRNVWNDRN